MVTLAQIELIDGLLDSARQMQAEDDNLFQLRWERKNQMSYSDNDAIEYKGLTYRIEQDVDSLNPRIEYDNAATMYCEHKNYDLGDPKADAPWQSTVDPRDPDGEYYGNERAVDWAIAAGAEMLPLYLYDHSGITMSTGSFRDPWDSGQVGYIFMEKETIAKEFGYTKGKTPIRHKSNRVTAAMRRRAIEVMEQEVKTYDQYLTGDVYGFIVYNADGEQIDSCWGFFGDEWAEQEAKAAVDYIVKTAKPFQM